MYILEDKKKTEHLVRLFGMVKMPGTMSESPTPLFMSVAISQSLINVFINKEIKRLLQQQC